jgi:colicin import membrane protein
MLRHNRLRLAVPFLLVSATFSVCAYAQSQDSQTDSVAEAARRAREQKKAAGDKPAPVITDDILKPSAPQAPAASSDQAAADQKDADASKTEGGAAKEGDKEKTAAELADAKQQLADAEKAVDLAKRELALEQDNLYSKPDFQNDTAGKAKLDDLTQQIADKQQAVDDLKTRVADLEAKAGTQAPASEEPPQTPPQPQL